jgi:hypothetical protein
MKTRIVAVPLVAILVYHNVFPYTTFCLKQKNQIAVGYNYDFPVGLGVNPIGGTVC